MRGIGVKSGRLGEARDAALAEPLAGRGVPGKGNPGDAAAQIDILDYAMRDFGGPGEASTGRPTRTG